MAIFQSCSIDQVIGRIIRNTRVQDTAYIADMVEWIPEAMEMMGTRQQTEGAFTDPPLRIQFHKVRLPCGLLYVDAIEHRGRRLHYGNSVKNIRRPRVHGELRPSINQTWTSNPIRYPAPNADQANLYFSTLTKVLDLPLHDHHYYEIEYGTILTDFPEGLITIYYRRTPVDEKGLPLIPDNSNYKEALYWYVLSKMIVAGFDTKLKLEYCDGRFEFYMARAVAEIDYPSPDQMESKLHTFSRLIPPEHYFENFFRVDRAEQFYDPLGPMDTHLF